MASHHLLMQLLLQLLIQIDMLNLYQRNWLNQLKLVGKVFWPVLTAGASQSSYSEEGINRHTLADFFIAYPQIAHLCGMRYEKPYEIFSSRQQTQAAIQDVANGYRGKLIELLAGMTDG